MRYLIDTNICIYLMNQRSQKVWDKFVDHNTEIALSSITLCELHYGAHFSQNPQKNIKRIETFVHPFPVLPFEDSAAKQYGIIRADLRRKGTHVGKLDTQIASIAISQNLTLVTHNEKEFRRVEGLTLENWTTT